MKKIILLVAIFALSCSQGKSNPVDEDTVKTDSDEKTADIEQTDDSSDVTPDNKVDEDVQTVDEKQDESDDEAKDESSVDDDSVDVDMDNLIDDDLIDEDIQPDDIVQPDEDVFLSGNEYYCDPVSGLIGNDGSEASPWPSLAEVFAAKKTFSAGDVIYLRSGAHGEPFITGINSDYVHVIGYPGETPVVASVQMG